MEIVFNIAGLKPVEQYVKINSRLFRPHEVPYLLGDNSKAKRVLKWEPQYKFEDLAKLMYQKDHKNIGEKNDRNNISNNKT